MHILLVDDHTLFREALIHVLKQLDNQVSVLEAADAEQAMQLILHTRNLDLILLDLDLPDLGGLKLLPDIRNSAPTVPIVVVSGSESANDVRSALEKGVVGYISKSCGSHEMLAALDMVMQGDIYIPPKLLCKLGPSPESANSAANRNQIASPLTARQLEVLILMVKGLPNKSIAKNLGVTEGTIKLHIAAIFRVLNAKNRTQATREAIKLGLVT